MLRLDPHEPTASCAAHHCLLCGVDEPGERPYLLCVRYARRLFGPALTFAVVVLTFLVPSMLARVLDVLTR